MGAVESTMLAGQAVGLTGSVGFKSLLAGMLFMAMLASLMGRPYDKARLVFACYGVLGFGFLLFPPWGLLALLMIVLAVHARFLVLQQDSQMLTAAGLVGILELVALLSVWLFESDSSLLAAPVLCLFIADLLTKAELATPSFVPFAGQGARTELEQEDNLPDRSVLRNQFYRQDVSEGHHLILLRLQGFEQINRSLGNEFSDLLLLQSIKRMLGYLNDTAVVNLTVGEYRMPLARIGSYDFAFITSHDPERLHVHEQLIGQLLTAINKPFSVDGCIAEVKPRASYIQLVAGQNFEHALSLLFQALNQLPYEDVVPFNADMEKEFQLRKKRLKELSEVYFADSFELYFQPVVEVQSKQVAYLELLLRWRHPEEGMLAAEQFIDDLERAGRGYALATFVMEKAAELAMALRMEGIRTPLSVNLFGFELLHPDFVEFMAEIMDEHNLSSGDLILETPLSAFLDLDDQGLSIIKRLNNIGIEICLDGLGNTPIWLAKLPKLKFNYVKLDRELTSDLDFTSHGRGVLRGLIDMHSHLNAKVICQAIERPAQLSFIKELKAFGAQGFLFSQPLSTVGCISWLKQWKHKLENNESPFGE